MNNIYNVSDTEPPVPGGNGNINAGISWAQATDDFTATNKLEYMVVSHTHNRITNAESAVRNGSSQGGSILMNWSRNVTTLNGATGNFITVLVRDEAGNIASYNVRN